MRHSTSIGPATFSQLDRLHLSEGERLSIIAYIHDGQVIAGLMLGAMEGIRSGVEFAERGIRAILPSHAKH